MAIKKDDVFRAADAIFAGGVAPSLVGVRTALGSGSYSTISGFLAEWKSASRSAPVIGCDDAPDEVNDVFAPALRSMWAVAQREAAAELESFKLDVVQKMADLAFKEKESLDLVDALQSECDGYINKSLSLRCEVEELRSANFDMAQVVTACKAREHELRLQHDSLLSKIGPITVRKDRLVAPIKPPQKLVKKA